MLVDVRTLSAVLSCHEESVRRWIRSGKLRAHHTPGGQRVDIASVDLPADVRQRLITEWRAALDRVAAGMLAK